VKRKRKKIQIKQTIFYGLKERSTRVRLCLVFINTSYEINLGDINPNLPCLRVLTWSQTQKRRTSCSTNSKSSHSSSSTQSYDSQIIENLIEKFNKFGINTDERNIFGFTPLLLGNISKQFLGNIDGLIDIFRNFLWKI
jgi:hypothetical protein